MAFQISHLRGDDQQIAIKCFGPPPQTIVRKFTGGEPQHYQKVRRELRTLANGKGIWDMMDYAQGVVVAAGAVPNYGALGGNITELNVGLNPPDRNVIVTNQVAAAVATETENHQTRTNAINTAFPGVGNNDRRREEKYKADCDHRQELARINSTLQNSLESRYEAENERFRRAREQFRDEQEECMELFLKLFNGSALHSIQGYLHSKSYRRALYILDEQYGLAPSNQDAIDILHSQLRTMKFKDSENLRTQLDDFEMILNQLIQLGLNLTDADQKNMLFSALRNGGIIYRLYMNDLTIMKSHALAVTLAAQPPLTFAQTFGVINRRYNDLSAEASSIVATTKRSNPSNSSESSKKKGRTAAYVAEAVSPNQSEDDDYDLPAVALAAITAPKKKPQRGNKNSKLKCGKCGRNGHTAKQCLSDYTCKVCNKPGHKENDCWHNQTCEKCGKKGHLARICNVNKPKKESGTSSTSSQSSKSAGGSFTQRAMKHVRGNSSA